MNEGFVYRDGEKYFKYQDGLVKHLRSTGTDPNNELSDEFIVNESYNLEEHYYTEWDDEDDFQFIMMCNELVEIEETA